MRWQEVTNESIATVERSVIKPIPSRKREERLLFRTVWIWRVERGVHSDSRFRPGSL